MPKHLAWKTQGHYTHVVISHFKKSEAAEIGSSIANVVGRCAFALMVITNLSKVHCCKMPPQIRIYSKI